jgi:hypothetical protein
MSHTIRFADDFLIHFLCARGHRPQRLLIPKGTPVRAQVKPYVVERAEGPVELADLILEDGTAAHMIPFACFSFVE